MSSAATEQVVRLKPCGKSWDNEDRKHAFKEFIAEELLTYRKEKAKQNKE